MARQPNRESIIEGPARKIPELWKRSCLHRAGNAFNLYSESLLKCGPCLRKASCRYYFGDAEFKNRKAGI
jgi:hypothetical protein